MGEQNRSGVLLAKRTLVRVGYILLIPLVFIFCIRPEIIIGLYSVDDALMLVLDGDG